jgi:hypothetical protein
LPRVAVIRRFRPWDLGRVHGRRLAAEPLELESATLEAPPLRRAAWACLRPHGAVATWVEDGLEPGLPAGYVQARWRLDGHSADLTWLAPRLADGAGVANTWGRLLATAGHRLTAAGAERLYGVLPEDAVVAQQVFRQQGYTTYGQDTVYRRPDARLAGDGAGLRVVDETDVLRHAVRALATAPPRLDSAVAEPDDWDTYPLGGRAARGLARRVWLGPRGEVLGAWVRVLGPRGCWLRLVVAPEADGPALCRRALAELAGLPAADGPVYAAARDHEPLLHGALRSAGFETVVHRRRLVRHAAVRVLAPGWRRRPVADARPAVVDRGLPMAGPARRPTSHIAGPTWPAPSKRATER